MLIRLLFIAPQILLKYIPKIYSTLDINGPK